MTKSYFFVCAFSVEGSNFVSREITSKGEPSPFSHLLLIDGHPDQLLLRALRLLRSQLVCS
jgi:hypothetical protein